MGQPVDPPLLYGIHWVITGGESGPGFRPAIPSWFRSIRRQCAAANVAFFQKQLGGVRDHRGNLEDFPEDLRVRQFPTVEGIA
jgi:protein gp37